MEAEKQRCIEEKQKYMQMKTKIESAIKELKASKNNMDNANTELRKSYQSNAAKNEYAKLEAIISEMNGDINTLNNTILPEVQRKISELNTRINEINVAIKAEKKVAEEMTRKEKKSK